MPLEKACIYGHAFPPSFVLTDIEYVHKFSLLDQERQPASTFILSNSLTFLHMDQDKQYQQK